MFDLISIDCTNVDIPITDDGPHMGIPNIRKAVKKLSDIGSINNDTIKVINHFSHNANPLKQRLEKRVSGMGFIVPYDGLCTQI